MAIKVEQIDFWRSLPSETEVLEFKEAKNQFDNTKLCRYCVAIANEGGGHLLLGIKNEPPRIVVGTNAFNNIPGITQKLLDEVGFRVDVYETAHPQGRIVTFHIPSRPRATPLHYKGEYLMRSGEALVPMSPDTLKRICAEEKPDWIEEIVITGAGISTVMQLLDTETYFRLINVPYPSSPDDIAAQLVRDRLIAIDAYSGFGVRKMAALLLARNLDDFPEVSRKAPRVILYGGTSKLTPVLDDQTWSKGYAVGFQEIVQFIHRSLPHNEVIRDALRTEVRLVGENVIRELAANALIHQDLQISGASVMVEVFTNRIEISNPGEPIIAVERLIDGYQSRNERLASLMRKMRICEERGRGIDEVVKSAELGQLPAPEFRATEKRTVVTVFGHRAFDLMDREDRVRACYQHCVLKRVMSEQMTNKTLRQRFALPESKTAIVSQIIAATIDAGLIQLDTGAGRSRKFASYLPFWASI
jgi:ATP-dependent DNA helicase RecG